jgi:hypothetical protein
VKNKEEALETIKNLVPKGASVFNAGSTTLWEIGLVDHLKKQTGKILGKFCNRYRMGELARKGTQGNRPCQTKRVERTGSACWLLFYISSCPHRNWRIGTLLSFRISQSFRPCAVLQEAEAVKGEKFDLYVGPFLFSARHVVVVAGTNKIVHNLEKARERQEKIALQLEGARARIAYAAMGVKGSAINFSGNFHLFFG